MVFLYQEMTIEQRSYLVLVAHLSSPILCRSPFSWVYSKWAITRSFVLHLYTNPSLPSIHVRRAIKAHTQGQKYQQPRPGMKMISCPQILHEFPLGNGPIIAIIPSSSWLQFQLTQAFEYSTITHHFMVTNHAIMSGHFSPSNIINQSIKLPS
jgi:hypothetical protein